MWVPLPINPDLSAEKRDEIIKDLKSRLNERPILISVSKDLGLPRKWQLASDEEAALELGKRLFVRAGEVNAPQGQGKVPSIDIGVSGKSKEQAVSGEIAMRLMQDVCKFFGVKPPPAKP